ncbi:hypothetical protein IMCC14465_02190 [alpha proteobacterium IMCC14465]|uniref:Integral membrane protein CcmA involved in cell shape determination n=1 Tax=alpha proteobacterium IMCC14465 TaxID=1220535 RepID=J9A608_9PROT|nr:hypothetical protein IMCC14465_02190 [alpha proteobacterium IMCC14465]
MSSSKIIKSGKAAPSILSSDINVIGQLFADGEIHIDGHVDGDVRSATLVIGESANVKGEIAADDVTIRGRVKGTILGKRVHLCATSHVEGEIFHEALAIESGSFFNGSVHREKDPLAKASIPLDVPAPSTETKPSTNGHPDKTTQQPSGQQIN